MTMNNNTTLSIYAQALIDNRQYKNMRINGEAVGVMNARAWTKAVKAMRLPAYAVREYRYNNMGNTEEVAPCNQTPLYNALKPVLELVGTVNGAKLNSKNIAEEIIGNVMKFKNIDTSAEMAHAHNELHLARKLYNKEPSEENEKELEAWKDKCAVLEHEPGNCKKVAEIVSETAFIKAVEILLGDAILKQTIKSAEDIAAEEEAKRQERRAKTKAKRQAKAKEEAAK